MSEKHKQLDKTSDEELVRQYTSGNGRAFTTLYDRYHEVLIPFLKLKVGTWEQAEDLYQVTMTKLSVQLPDPAYYREENHYKSYLYTVARYTAIDWLKARKDKRMDGMGFKQQWEADRGYPLMFLLRKKDIRWCIKKLKEKAQRVIYYHFYKDLTFERIAKKMRMALGTVTSIYSRALTKIAWLLHVYFKIPMRKKTSPLPPSQREGGIKPRIMVRNSLS